MLCSLVPEIDAHWKFLLQLKDITEMLFSYKLSDTHLLHQKLKIQDHLADFQELFPGRNLLPKHHFMLHMPDSIRLFGPLRMCWCMRFENKHSYFTHLTTVVRNFKNLSSSLANRHQRHQAFLCSASLAKQDVHLSASYIASAPKLSDSVRELLSTAGADVHRPLHTCRYVVINGIRYAKNMYAVLDVVESNVTFGRIDAIYVQNLKPFFHVHLHSSYFDCHSSSYCLQQSPKSLVLQLQQFHDYYPLSAYRVGGTKHVVLKNFIFDEREYL